MHDGPTHRTVDIDAGLVGESWRMLWPRVAWMPGVQQAHAYAAPPTTYIQAQAPAPAQAQAQAEVFINPHTHTGRRDGHTHTHTHTPSFFVPHPHADLVAVAGH